MRDKQVAIHLGLKNVFGEKSRLRDIRKDVISDHSGMKIFIAVVPRDKTLSGRHVARYSLYLFFTNARSSQDKLGQCSYWQK